MKKRGQVWVETVIYTLIAFALIGSVLAFIKPEIDKQKDKSILVYELGMMNSLDETFNRVMQSSPGNVGTFQLSIRKGTLIIDGSVRNKDTPLDQPPVKKDKIQFIMESNYEYSEAGIGVINVSGGTGITVDTYKKGRIYMVNFTKEYDYDITTNGNDERKEITYSQTMYDIQLANKKDDDGKITANFNI